MKTITFRPLRRVKKTGKIVCASYMQWYRVKCANYSEFNLVVDSEYERLPKDEFVYNHEGKLLFHFNYNPWDVFEYHGSCIEPGFDWDELREAHKSFTIVGCGSKSYHWIGADCCGTPTFTHYDEERVAQKDTFDYHGPDAFQPVTVEYVITWLGWFLYQLENSKLKIKK